LSEEINFNYSPFEENVIVVGGAGRGKTTRAKWILTQISNLPYGVYDYNYLFNGFGKIIHKIEEIKREQFIFQPIDRSYNTFISFCNKIFYGSQRGELANMVIFFDELHQYLTKQRVCEQYNQIIMTARNYGISTVNISTRPATIPNTTLSNSIHCFAYGLSNFGDIVWLRDYIGDKAWLLLSRDKRTQLKEEKELTKHSCIYRNQLEPESQIIICECEYCNQQRSQFPDVYL